MPVVRFAWSPMLVDLRREVCPSARWQKRGRHWVMSETDAQAFIRAAQARLDFSEVARADKCGWYNLGSWVRARCPMSTTIGCVNGAVFSRRAFRSR